MCDHPTSGTQLRRLCQDTAAHEVQDSTGAGSGGELVAAQAALGRLPTATCVLVVYVSTHSDG
jgi:hypothetical protein